MWHICAWLCVGWCLWCDKNKTNIIYQICSRYGPPPKHLLASLSWPLQLISTRSSSAGISSWSLLAAPHIEILAQFAMIKPMSRKLVDSNSQRDGMSNSQRGSMSNHSSKAHPKDCKEHILRDFVILLYLSPREFKMAVVTADQVRTFWPVPGLRSN